MQQQRLVVGDRVLYRYSPAGKVIFGVVCEVLGEGRIGVRTNINPGSYRPLVMYRNESSWQEFDDKSNLHKMFTTFGSVKPWCLVSVSTDMRAKLARI